VKLHNHKCCFISFQADELLRTLAEEPPFFVSFQCKISVLFWISNPAERNSFASTVFKWSISENQLWTITFLNRLDDTKHLDKQNHFSRNVWIASRGG
jgi:hypothetical protein